MLNIINLFYREYKTVYACAILTNFLWLHLEVTLYNLKPN